MNTNTRAWGNPLTTPPDSAPIPAAASRYPSAVQSPRRPPSLLAPLLSPLSVAQGNDTTRLHYDLRTLPLNVRLSARDPTTEGAPERYLPRSDVRHLMLKNAFHPSLGVRPTSFSRRAATHPSLLQSIWVVSSLFSWVIPVQARHSDLILIGMQHRKQTPFLD